MTVWSPPTRTACRSALRLGALTSRRRSYTAAAAALNHCVELVRAHDRERFLCNLHAPAAARSGLFALHAFNYETARVRSATSQESVGRARLAWWRNALQDAIDGAPPDHPVAQALAHAHHRHGLTSRYLHQLVDAREADLRVQQPRDVEEVRQYCERTAGSLLLLGLECAGVSGSDAAERAASNAGTALGMATLLRGTAAHASQGCTYIPAEVTSRHGVRLTEMLRGNPSNELCDAVAEVADEAVAHLLAARSMRPDVPSEVRALLLPTVVADHILARLQNCGYSPFAQELHAPFGLSLQCALLARRWTGYY